MGNTVFSIGAINNINNKKHIKKNHLEILGFTGSGKTSFLKSVLIPNYLNMRENVIFICSDNSCYGNLKEKREKIFIDFARIDNYSNIKNYRKNILFKSHLFIELQEKGKKELDFFLELLIINNIENRILIFDDIDFSDKSYAHIESLMEKNILIVSHQTNCDYNIEFSELFKEKLIFPASNNTKKKSNFYYLRELVTKREKRGEVFFYKDGDYNPTRAYLLDVLVA